MELLRNQQYLEIRHINEQDAGIYSCVAQNMAGQAKQNLQVQVLGKFFFSDLIFIINDHLNSF